MLGTFGYNRKKKKKKTPQKNTRAWVDWTKTQALLRVESVKFSDDI